MDAPFPSIEDLPFRCESQADLLALPEPAWLIHNVIPKGSLSLVFGPSGSGKSFLATDMAYCLALKRPWFGCDIDEHIRVLYVAAEAGGGVAKRVKAFRQHYDVQPRQDCPLFFIRQPIDLLHEATAEDLITCWAVIGHPELLILDTWNRCMRGNENASRDVGLGLETIDRFRQTTGAAVMVIHHTPLSDKERPRGHGSLFAAADTAIAVDGLDGPRIAKLTYQRDGEAGLRFPFKLLNVDVGTDAKGRIITSCAVEQTEAPPEQNSSQLSANEKTFLTILQEAMPHGLTVEEWNAQAREIDLCKGQKQRLYDLRIGLDRKGKIHSSMDRWYVTMR